MVTSRKWHAAVRRRVENLIIPIKSRRSFATFVNGAKAKSKDERMVNGFRGFSSGMVIHVGTETRKTESENLRGGIKPYLDWRLPE